MKNPRLALTLSLGTFLVSHVSANAQVIASEGFNYNAGTAVITAEGTGGTGWANPWNSKSDTTQTVVSATSLSYTDGSGNTLATSGGSLISATANSTTAQPERELTSTTFGALAAANPATGAAGTLWMSYLWQGLNTTGSGSGLYRQASLMFLQGATSAAGSGSERLDIGMPNISAVNQATVLPNLSLWSSGGLAGQTLSSTAPLQSTVAANNGSTTFVLIEMTMDNVATTADTINIWFNPTLTGATPVGAANLTYSLADLSGLNGIRLQSGSLSAADGTVGGQQQVDEINFGDTAADVEPLQVANTPEPGTIALAAIGGLAILGLRRKC
jgi:hypothetical protein